MHSEKTEQPLSVLLIVWVALSYAKTSTTITIWDSLNFHIQIDTVLLLRVSCSFLEEHEINQLPW